MSGTSAIRYHMSRRLHERASVLCGNGQPKIDPVIETLLEGRRPKHLLSRYEAVFTVSTPDFRRLGIEFGYIYSVEVTPPEQSHDTHWIGKLQRWRIAQKHNLSHDSYYNCAEDLLNQWCDNYWSGSASGEPFWEYLAAKATVVEVLSSKCVRAADTGGGWKPPADA